MARRLVRATRVGYVDMRVRQPGDTFAWDGALASWMEEAEPVAQVADPTPDPSDDAGQDPAPDFEAMSDQDLRAFIGQTTGKPPHHALGRPKLIAMALEAQGTAGG